MMTLLVEAALRSLALGTTVWLALHLLRVRNPHIGQAAWRWVLLAGLSMPLLMQYRTLVLPPPAPELLSIVRLDSMPSAPDRSFDWQIIAMPIYAIVAVVLALRQLLGYAIMRRIHRAAASVQEPWTRGMDVRASTALRAPVVFASTILIPADYAKWNSVERQSVLEHERMHVTNRDFFFQMLTHAHRVLFWFSPLAWWLPHRLGLLSEQLSDDAAIRAVRDRAGYAEILLDFAGASDVQAAMSQGAVGMARTKTLIERIERIVSTNELPAVPGVARRMALAAILVPFALVIAGCSAKNQEQVQPAANAAPITSTPAEPTSDAAPTLADITSLNGPQNFDKEPILPENAKLPRSDPAFPLSHAQYPQKSRKIGQEGTVVLQLYILADGSVENVKIAKSSGVARLDYSAANEAFNWKLQPGSVDGQPQAMWGRFAVTFKLEPEQPSKPPAPNI